MNMYKREKKSETERRTGIEREGVHTVFDTLVFVISLQSPEKHIQNIMFDMVPVLFMYL
jgi:hypothetical protein